MNRRAWRRIGLLLQSASLAIVAIVATGTVAQILATRSPSDDPHGYGLFFGSILVAVLSTIGLVGVLGLGLWWRTGRDTPIILYDVLVILVAAQFLEPALDTASDGDRSSLSDLVPLVIIGGFMLATSGAALAVYRSRRASPDETAAP